MYIDRHTPQKIFSENSSAVWSIDDKSPQEIMLILDNMITAYKINLLSGMTVLNAVNSIIYGFEGILKKWFVGLTKEDPGIIGKWSNTVMLGTDGLPIKLSDGTEESNYIGKMIDSIREEFCGTIADTKQVQELFLHRQKLRRMEFFHPYYYIWLRRLFELDDHRLSKWKQTFIVSLPKWFIPKLQKILSSSPPNPSWGTLYNMVMGAIIQLCDEKSIVKRVLKDRSSSKNIDLLCRQYNLPLGPNKISQGGAVVT